MFLQAIISKSFITWSSYMLWIYVQIYLLSCQFTGSSKALEVAAESAERALPFEVKFEVDATECPSDDKTRPYLCTVCDRRFTTKRYLNIHRNSHTGKNLYSCTECDKHFSFRSSFIQHMNIHAGKYKCTECGKCCHSNYALALHRRSHSGKKPVECRVSSKQPTTSHGSVVHERVHSVKKRYKGPVSGKVFSESAGLNNHKRDHTGEKSRLQKPKKSLSQASKPKSQQAQGNVEYSTQQYQCRYCRKLFKTNLSLKNHICTHTRKSYYCRHCSNSFTFSGQLRQHLLTSHSDGTLLICYICQSSFTHWQLYGALASI